MADIGNLQWDVRVQGETPLRKMQLVELRLLRIVDYICKKHNITYMLIAGTLLGAVRHKGFIPWDDDIDLWMSASDISKFIKVAKQELPSDVFLQTCATDKKYTLPWIKIRDAYSSAYTDQKKFDAGDHVGISLDIFPYLKYPADSAFLRKLLDAVYITGWFSRQKPSESTMKTRLIHYPAVPLYFLLRLVLSIIRICMPKKYIGTIPEVGGDGRYKKFAFEAIYPLRTLMFEGYEFPVPADFDFVLKQSYGTYWELPPADKRVCHEKHILPFTPCLHPNARPWPNTNAPF